MHTVASVDTSLTSRLSISQICFPGANIAQLENYWRALSVERIGCLSPLLLNDIDAMCNMLARNQWQLETVTHVFLVGNDLSQREAVAAARARLLELIGKAERAKARSIYMLTGSRGPLSWEQAADSFCEAIAPCVERAKNAGIALAIENAPAVYADLHIAHTLQDTLALAEMADIGVCIELFACWAEANLPQLFERAMPRCCLVQVSDYIYGDRTLPARAVPGDGAIPLRQIIQALMNAGYRGAFDLELVGPRIDSEGHFAAAQRAMNYLRQMFGEIAI